MKKYLFSLALFSVLNAPTFASTFPAHIEGRYSCDCIEVGTNVLYKGSMSIKKTGQTYAIKGKFDDGSKYLGTGIYNHDKHSLSIVFINPKNSEETGIVVADVHHNYNMTAAWTYLHSNVLGHSTCIKRSV